MQPVFKLQSNDKDITELIKDRLQGFTLIDSLDDEADSLSIILSDAPFPDGSFLELPKAGVLIDLWLGFAETGIVPVGRWVVSSVESSGDRKGDLMSITATGGDLLEAKKGGVREFFENTTLGNILRILAARNKCEPYLDKDLSDIAIDQIFQDGESDQAFLQRLAKLYGASGSMRGNVLIFKPEGMGTDPAGANRPLITLNRSDLSAWSLSIPRKAKYNSVAVRWVDYMAGGIKKTEIVGDGDPVLYVDALATSKRTAYEKAAKKLKKFQLGEEVVTIKGAIPVREKSTGELVPRLLLPDTPVEFTGLRDQFSGRWFVRRVEISFMNSGFSFTAHLFKNRKPPEKEAD